MPKTNRYDMLKHDVIIAGAGPAGLSTALHLAQIAPDLVPRTLILEKARHPRPKLCGGGLLPDAEVVLRRLSLDMTEVPHYDVDWAHFDYDGKGMRMRGEKKGLFAFRTIRRDEFDAWLAGKARDRGIEIREGVTVKAVRSGDDGVCVETDAGTFSAQVVVGADGSKGVVRRAVIPHEGQHVARLLEIVTEPKPEKSAHIQADSYFDFVVVPQGILGYVWDFPAVEKGKPVRVRGVYDSNVHAVKKDMTLRDALADEFRRHGLELSDYGSRLRYHYKLEGHPIRWFEAKSVFSAPRVLLVGDAAGVDALYGEGISIALGYGDIAARAIQEAFATKDFSFGNYKRAILRSEMGKALRRRAWFAKFFYGLRSATIQRLVWQRLGPVIEWIVRTFLIEWARREERFTLYPSPVSKNPACSIPVPAKK
jgi:flavin-dependent dehydrogenase